MNKLASFPSLIFRNDRTVRLVIRTELENIRAQHALHVQMRINNYMFGTCIIIDKPRQRKNATNDAFLSVKYAFHVKRTANAWHTMLFRWVSSVIFFNFIKTCFIHQMGKKLYKNAFRHEHTQISIWFTTQTGILALWNHGQPKWTEWTGSSGTKTEAATRGMTKAQKKIGNNSMAQSCSRIYIPPIMVFILMLVQPFLN